MEQYPVGRGPEHGVTLTPAMRQLAQKAYFLEQIHAGAELIDPDARLIVQNSMAIEANLMHELTDATAGAREQIRNHLTEDTLDVFSLEAKAASLVDDLTHGVEAIDIADFLLATRSFALIADAAQRKGRALSEKRVKERLTPLGDAFCIELASRMHPSACIPYAADVDVEDVDFMEFYDHICGDVPGELDEAAAVAARQLVVDQQMRVHDVVRMAYAMGEGELVSPIDKTSPFNGYNRPLSFKRREAINEHAADVVERLSLLGLYPVIPMVASAKDVGLPWDIAVLPSVNYTTDTHEEGAIADFMLIDPDDDRSEAPVRVEEVPGAPEFRHAVVGNTNTRARFRLHQNGQISYGHLTHNVPNDAAEKLFALGNASDAFVRMRALLIAIAFDSITSEDVVKDAGGSVPTEYRKIRRHAPPDAEPTLELVLRRRRVLERAGVSPENRRPEGWEAPPANVAGHRRKLKPGYKRRSTAETEARAYYASIGREFPGLPDDMTFVSAHARGTPASEVPLRRARFRPKSETALLLGSLGLGPNSGKRKGGAKKSKRGKKR